MNVNLITGPSFVSEALFGLGLSYGITSEFNDVFDIYAMSEAGLRKRLKEIARGLAHKQGGHNKFLETIMFTLDVKAPRYWWQEFDTYRAGITKQSESTMHTIMSRALGQTDFEGGITTSTLALLNAIRGDYIRAKEEGNTEYEQQCFMDMKAELPEGFLQRRIVALNAKTLQNMYMQRKNHKLPEWQVFFKNIKEYLLAEGSEASFVYECVFGEAA